jgi:hypothetical protein
MGTMKTVLVVVVLGLWSWLVLGQAQSATCVVKTRTDLSKTCQGKTVQLEGTLGLASAHPTMTTPVLLHQNYLDTALGQIVLLSQTKIECAKKKLSVVGKLGWKALGGAAGTRNAYANAFVSVTNWKCL